MKEALIGMLSDLDMKYRSEIRLVAERRKHETQLRKLKMNMALSCTMTNHVDLGEVLLQDIKKAYVEVVDILDASYAYPRNEIKSICINHHYDLVSTAFTIN